MREKESYKNKSAGITLIALVVTIIVLLILAGISIQMLTGNNGILTKAGEAKEKTGTVGLTEEVQIALMEKQIDSSIGTDSKTLRERIESGISDAKIEEIIGTDGTSKYTDVYYVKKGNDYVTVYEDGDIEEGKSEIWDGKKISCPKFKEENGVWNWYIYTPSQLKFLADFVNNGDGQNLPEELKDYVTEAGYKQEDVKMSTDTTIHLMKNLDLGARQKDGTKTIGEAWNPIGKKSVVDKLGTFEGNNHYIRGVYVKRTEPCNGIFSNSNTIRDLTIKDSYVLGQSATGGIVGAIRSGEIKNCHNINTTVIIEEKYTNVGGVVGQVQAESIIECTNTGTIMGKGQYVGGIAGFIASVVNTTINNCTNSGLVIGQDQAVGGILGGGNSGNISDCKNNGDITGKVGRIGGIAGYEKGNIIRCINNAKINGENNMIGGIVGNLIGSTNDCINNGIIEGSNIVGGVVGYAEEGEVSKCINKGSVITKGSSMLGGVVGRLNSGTINKCMNSGVITGKNLMEIGGIVGMIGWNKTSGTLKNSYNMGKLILEGDNNKFIGGVIGYLINNSEMKYSYNIGEIEIKGTGATDIGGVIGKAVNSVTSNNYYLEGKSNVTFDSTEGEARSSDNMKTKEFLGKLNEGQNPAVWEFREGENDGYPVIIKTEE